MKICVYAIAKNEEQFVDRFMDACTGADAVCVLDTGSTDRTVEKLEARGAIVRQEVIDPWRFDEARNRSMELIPQDTDFAVCIDLDEVLCAGWREKLEAAIRPDTNLVRFMNVRSRNADGTHATAFLIGKVHRPGLFRWKYPVHEVLVWESSDPSQRCVIANAPDMEVDHLPDTTKSRGQYLPLLELGAREYPDDPRCVHYLGREYMYRGRWNEAIHWLKYHVTMPRSDWAEERAASMRYIAECNLWGLDDKSEAMRWALRACAEVPGGSENWYEAEKAAYALMDWMGVEYFARRALSCKPSGTAINEGDAWGPGPHDLLSIALWKMGRNDEAKAEAEAALALDPSNERISGNVKYFEGVSET